MKIEAAEEFAHSKFVSLKMYNWYCHVFGEVMFRKLEKIEHQMKILRGEPIYTGRILVGACYNDGGSHWIALRRKYVLKYNSRKVKKIILHEIAHAIRGAGFGHDDKFRKIAKRLGAYINNCPGDSL